MTRARPTISVVVPVHNLAIELGATLASVLAQTVLPDEIIVIDDGSADRSAAVAEEMAAQNPTVRILVIRRAHEGPGAARNAGVEAARSDWVAFLDGDDLWEPEKIEALNQAMDANPTASMIVHDFWTVGANAQLNWEKVHRLYDPAQPLLPQIFRTNFIATSSAAVRRDVLRGISGFDTTLAASQDFELWLRLATVVTLVFIPKPLERYVERRASVSRRIALRYRCLLRIAYQHAPALVPLTGWRRAYCLRLRLVLIAHYNAWVQLWRGGSVREFLAVCVSAPFQISRALLTPLRASSHPIVPR